MPLYHAAGMYLSLLLVHYWDTPVALGIPDRPIAPDMIINCLRYNDCDSVIVPPATLEELSQDENAINVLKKLTFVGFGGGNLAPESGHLLVRKGVKLMNFIAATEYVTPQTVSHHGTIETDAVPSLLDSLHSRYTGKKMRTFGSTSSSTQRTLAANGARQTRRASLSRSLCARTSTLDTRDSSTPSQA